MQKKIFLIILIMFLTGCGSKILNEKSNLKTINRIACVEENNTACCNIQGAICHYESNILEKLFKKCEKDLKKCLDSIKLP